MIKSWELLILSASLHHSCCLNVTSRWCTETLHSELIVLLNEQTFLLIRKRNRKRRRRWRTNFVFVAYTIEQVLLIFIIIFVAIDYLYNITTCITYSITIHLRHIDHLLKTHPHYQHLRYYHLHHPHRRLIANS